MPFQRPVLLVFLLRSAIGAGCFALAVGEEAPSSPAQSSVAVDVGDGRLVAVDPQTGETSWESPAPFPKRGVRQFVARETKTKTSAGIDPWSPNVQVFFRRSQEGMKETTNDVRPRAFAIADNPQALAFAPDGNWLYVACDPTGRADRVVCRVDLMTGMVSRRPIPGSSNLRGIAVDPTGQFALAVHLVPKSDLPATQVEQGWVFTNAISYVPLDDAQPIVTLPLDQRTRGYANPEGIAIAPDGKWAYVAHAGADLVSVLDLPALVAAAKELSGSREAGRYRGDDFRLTRRYVQGRIEVGACPRGIAVSADGGYVAVFNQFDETFSIINAETNRVTRTIPASQIDAASRDPAIIRGQKLFHSGKLAFSGQFSCASCHPDSHTDGLNWDLPADGFNNFRNTKTLLATAGTAPYGWTGSSSGLRERFEGTLRHLFQHEPTEAESAALEAYLAQLKYPQGLSPRIDPATPAAERGRALFQGVAQCNLCHSGSKLTDRKRHDVGTGSEGETEFDTPSLVRITQTPPYLHDGRAESLADIFSRHNVAGLHGNATDLSPEQLADLVEYLKSL